MLLKSHTSKPVGTITADTGIINRNTENSSFGTYRSIYIVLSAQAVQFPQAAEHK